MGSKAIAMGSRWSKAILSGSVVIAGCVGHVGESDELVGSPSSDVVEQGVTRTTCPTNQALWVVPLGVPFTSCGTFSNGTNSWTGSRLFPSAPSSSEASRYCRYEWSQPLATAANLAFLASSIPSQFPGVNPDPELDCPVVAPLGSVEDARLSDEPKVWTPLRDKYREMAGVTVPPPLMTRANPLLVWQW